MSYQTQHLQFTIDYILKQLTYANVREDLNKLSKSDKKWIAAALMQALDPIQKHNPKVIVINVDNGKLNEFFAALDNNDPKILFPENVTFILKRNGTSYEKKDGLKKEIYNRPKAKAKFASRRVTELAEELNEMLLDDDYDSVNSHEAESEDDYAVEAQSATYTPSLAAVQENLLRRSCSSQHLLQTVSEPRRFLQKSH